MSIVIGSIGIGLVGFGYSLRRRLIRYECENATGNGCVRFDGDEAALRHEDDMERSAAFMTIGSLFVMGAVFVATISAGV